MTPYPPIYLPMGIPRPASCPHRGSNPLPAGVGPDAVVGEGGIVTGGGGTLCSAHGYERGSAGWRRTPAGWWLQLAGQQPQHLLRTARHPRIIRRAVLDGAHPGQKWSVPVLLAPSDGGYISTVDGIWDGERYAAGDLAAVQETLMALASGLDLAPDLAAREAAVRQLVADLLAIDHWVDLDFLTGAEWLSERLLIAVPLAAMGEQVPEDVPA